MAQAPDSPAHSEGTAFMGMEPRRRDSELLQNSAEDHLDVEIASISSSDSGINERFIDIDCALFVNTNDMDATVDSLETHGLVVLCGPPGCGKTTLGHAILRRYRQKDFKPYVMVNVFEWRLFIKDERKHVVFMDGALGEVCLNYTEYNQWRAALPYIRELCRSKKCLLVLTVYPHVLRELCEADAESLFNDSLIVVNMLKCPLDEETKRKMLTTHLKELHLSTEEQNALVAKVLQKDVSCAAFPWCCRQLVNKLRSCSNSDDPGYAEIMESIPVFPRASDPTDIFTAPSECYVPFLQLMFSQKKVIAAVMALAMLGKGCFLHYPSRVQSQLKALGFYPYCDYALEKCARSLKESILNVDGDGFHNPVIRDAVGLAFGRSFSLPVMLKTSDVRFLVQRVRTAETRKEFSITIGPSLNDRKLLMQAFYDHATYGRLVELCQHPALHCQKFLAEFEAFEDLDQVVSAVDTVHKLPLLYWSAWGPTRHLTPWCLKHVIKRPEHDAKVITITIFAAAMLENNTSNQQSNILPMVNALPSSVFSRCDFNEVGLSLPSAEQCVTDELTAKRSTLIEKSQSGTVNYLNNPSLPVPENIVKMKPVETEDCGQILVTVPSKEWYTALRILSDRQVDEKDREGNTVLHLAAQSGLSPIVEMARKATNKDGLTLTQLAEHKTREQRAETAPLQNVDSLFAACFNGNRDKVIDLLCSNVTVNDRGIKKVTALHMTCGAGRTSIAMLLIEENADVNVRDEDGLTPLHFACVRGRTETAKLLLQHQADVNVKETQGYTPLHFASGNGYTETVRLLVEHGADVNATVKVGGTPLDAAARRKKRDACKVLIQHGAKVSKETKKYLKSLKISVPK